jgi:peptidoglycan L-alanyl-D-glutamate endopeptidase CwlK
MPFKWGKKSKERMKGVTPLLIECATRALYKSRYDMTIPWMGGVRTESEQNEIYLRGHSKADGYKKLSFHQSGFALDVIPTGEDPYSNTLAMNHFSRCMFDVWQDMLIEGKGTNYYLRWGGVWGASGWDKPHYELRKK